MRLGQRRPPKIKDEVVPTSLTKLLSHQQHEPSRPPSVRLPAIPEMILDVVEVELQNTSAPSAEILVSKMTGAPPPIRQRPSRRSWFLSALLFVMPAVFTFVSITVGYTALTTGWGHVARFSASLLRFAI